MVSPFEQWFGRTVVLRLKTGETRVPLCGIIVAESGGAVRLRIGGGWHIDVCKSVILAVEEEKAPLNSRSDQVYLDRIPSAPQPRVCIPFTDPLTSSYHVN
jgi:hypothetical protein